MSGILHLAVRFPEGRVTVEQIHASSGVPVPDILAITHTRSWPALGDDEPSWKLAARAGAEVVARADASRIGYVLFAGSGEWDLPFWSPAAAVARELRITRAHCFEVGNFCGAGTTALRIAADRVEREPRTLALVLVADRLSRMVDFSDPESKALFNFGDAAAALLVAAGHTPYTLLHTAVRTDPGWCDYYRGERLDGKVLIRRGDHREGLADAYVENFTDLVAQTLTALGAKPCDISHFLINHGDRDMHLRLLRELGIPEERSVFAYDRRAHMGGADTFVALDELERDGRLRSGELILLATSAMGFSWGITALERSS